MASKTLPKKITATYEETDAYRERGEKLGWARILKVIDGKSGRYAFSFRMDEAVAHKIHTMTSLIMGKERLSPREAFERAFESEAVDGE